MTNCCSKSRTASWRRFAIFFSAALMFHAALAFAFFDARISFYTAPKYISWPRWNFFVKETETDNGQTERRYTVSTRLAEEPTKEKLLQAQKLASMDLLSQPITAPAKTGIAK